MLKNKLLQEALTNIESTVEDKDVFARMVKAGTKIIYNKKVFNGLSQQLRKSKDPAGDVARGMVAVLGLMLHRARGTISPASVLPVGMALILDALDFMEQAGLVKVDAAVVDRATEEYIEALLPRVGLSREKLDVVLEEIRQVMADPQKVEAYQQSLGGVK